jgi:hypothetical protein
MLDMNVQHVVGPFALLMEGLMQVGLDRLLLAWNEHDVRPRKGEPGTGGRPSKRARARPHPGGQMQLPPGFDGVAADPALAGGLGRMGQADGPADPPGTEGHGRPGAHGGQGRHVGPDCCRAVRRFHRVLRHVCRHVVSGVSAGWLSVWSRVTLPLCWRPPCGETRKIIRNIACLKRGQGGAGGSTSKKRGQGGAGGSTSN